MGVPAKRARKKMKSDFDKPRLRAHTSSSSGSPLVKLERVLGARTLPELTQTTSDICDLLLQHDLRRKTFHAKCSSSRSLIARRTVAISQGNQRREEENNRRMLGLSVSATNKDRRNDEQAPGAGSAVDELNEVRKMLKDVSSLQAEGDGLACAMRRANLYQTREQAFTRRRMMRAKGKGHPDNVALLQLTQRAREEAEEREALQMYYENIRNGREPLPGQRHEFG